MRTMGMRAVLLRRYQKVMRRCAITWCWQIRDTLYAFIRDTFLMCMSVEHVGNCLFPRQSNHITGLINTCFAFPFPTEFCKCWYCFKGWVGHWVLDGRAKIAWWLCFLIQRRRHLRCVPGFGGPLAPHGPVRRSHAAKPCGCGAFGRCLSPRDLALPLLWINRVGRPALVAIYVG